MFIFGIILAIIGFIAFKLKYKKIFKIYNERKDEYEMKSFEKPLFIGSIAIWVISGIIIIKSSLFYLPVGEGAHVQFYLPSAQTVHIKSGLHYSLFGKVTFWKTTAWAEYFSKYDKEGGKESAVIPVRFRDGTKADVTGNIRFRIPPDKNSISALQKEYQSFENFRLNAIRQIMAKTVGLTANFMTAEESYTTKKNDFMAIIRDQLINGQYDTITEVKDGIPQSVIKYRKVTSEDDSGKKIDKMEVTRVSGNIFSRFKIELQDVAIKEIDYEELFDKMIKQKREAVQQAVIAKQEAIKAKQDTIKAAEEGKKNVKIAEYKALEEKKTATINAEKERDVAKLDLEKKQLIAKAKLVEGKAEADVRKMKKIADGALEQKLKALVDIHTAWANGKNSLVPSVNSSGSGNNANSAMNANLINAYLAKQLGVDMKMKNSSK